MVNKLICWWKKEHVWTGWIGRRYSDGRTWYWIRFCCRCNKTESTLENPE